MVTREATRIYQFITNNQAWFHFWWKENLVKHQKFSQHYDYGCSYIFATCLSNNLSMKKNLILDDLVISDVDSRFENDRVRPNSKWLGVIHVSSLVGYT